MINLDSAYCRLPDCDRPWSVYTLADDGEHMIKTCRECVDEIEAETFCSPFPILYIPTEYPTHA